MEKEKTKQQLKQLMAENEAARRDLLKKVRNGLEETPEGRKEYIDGGKAYDKNRRDILEMAGKCGLTLHDIMPDD